ncbi:hypothetical protein FHX37_0259 [Haloactinospora alba]|uniref:CDP-alcohol phosphatidyltransferase-like enzyme n=1 Tax=Haloactinospora alba TaxID=405555 RepID=A0A543NEY0_9ACTN|nr:hypothetical protein [Haloactinospora alba]TQN30382.1 hypothetical protein FHX37_0259 [Haloactinospora alba]
MAGAVASTPPGFGPASRAVARWAGRRGVSSLAVDRSAALLGALAAVWFCGGDTRGAVTGSFLLLVVLFADSVAARLATRPADALRVWLASLLAGARECAVYAGIAVGGAVSGVAATWEWATAALVAVALRAAVHDARRAAAPRGRVLGGSSPGRPEGGDPRGEVAPSRGQDGASPPTEPLWLWTHEAAPERRCVPRKWERMRRRAPGGGVARRLAASPHLAHLARFSQDTRFIVVALTTVVWDARVTFIALIVGCALTVTVRSRATQAAKPDEADNANHPGK